MPDLVVLSSHGRNRFDLIPNRHMVIGRDGLCDIVLREKSLSRQHARVFFDGEHYLIDDLKSLHGTFVNGLRVKSPTALKDGDRIGVSTVQMTFYASEAPSTWETAAFTLSDTSLNLPRVSPSQDVGLKTSPSGRLAKLVEISQRLGTSLNVDEIFPRVLDILFEMFPLATLGEINLVNAEGKLFPVALKHGRDDDSSILTRLPAGNELAQEVLSLGQPIVKMSDTKSAVDDDSSIVCVPLFGPSKTKLGTILLETNCDGHRFTDDELELISVVAIVTGHSVEYAYAFKRLQELDRIQRQLVTARKIQLKMLPRGRPTLPGYSFDAHYSAAQIVGGDHFFWHSIPESRVVVAVADACGKGLPAALLITQFATQVQQCIASARSLKVAMSSINRFVCGLGEGFITFALCVLDGRRHTLSIVNAGHLVPLCRRGGSGVVERLETEKGSLPLGIAPEEEFHPFTVPFEPGDEVFLFTDGISEAMAPDSSLYGYSRLRQAIATAHGNVKSQIGAIIADVERFRSGRAATDDSCLVGISRNQTSVSHEADSSPVPCEIDVV